ncbi:hypothetical protein BDB01DRAFT_857982, partial [Pilobolus umbonatus]
TLLTTIDLTNTQRSLKVCARTKIFAFDIYTEVIINWTIGDLLYIYYIVESTHIRYFRSL